VSSIDRASSERGGRFPEPLPPKRVRSEICAASPSAGAPVPDGGAFPAAPDVSNCAALDALATTLASHLRRDEDGGEHLRAILEQLPAGVIIAEAPGGRLLGYNRRAAELWGGPLPLVGSSEEYASQYHGFRADGSRYCAADLPLTRALRQGETVVDEEIEFRIGSGVTRVLLVSAAPVRNAEGQIRTAVATMVDVTQRRAD
jgi:PAS domain-containing protein